MDRDYYLRHNADYERFDLSRSQRSRKHRSEKLRKRASRDDWPSGGERFEK